MERLTTASPCLINRFSDGLAISRNLVISAHLTQLRDPQNAIIPSDVARGWEMFKFHLDFRMICVIYSAGLSKLGVKTITKFRPLRLAS